MILSISSDAEWNSGIGQIINWFAKTNYWRFFESADYGPGLSRISISLVCRYAEFEFQSRTRYSKKEKKIYIDIMLKLADFVTATFEERKRAVLHALLIEVGKIVEEYDVKEFDNAVFLADFNSKFTSFLN